MHPLLRVLLKTLCAGMTAWPVATVLAEPPRAQDRNVASARQSADWNLVPGTTQGDWLGRAQWLERRGDWLSLLDWGQRWTQSEPGNGLAWFVLGRALTALQRHPEAILAYQRSLRLDPADVYAHNNLGNVYRQRQRHEDALHAYRQAVRIDPAYGPAWHNIGITFFELRGMAGVVRALQRLDASDPALAAAWRSLALDYSRSRDERLTRDALSLLRSLSDTQREQMFDILLATQ